METYDFSWITEVIVVATWGLAPWFTFIALRESGRPLRLAWTAFTAAALWGLFAWISVRTDLLVFDGLIYQIRPILMLTIALSAAMIVAKRVVGPGLNQRWLISLQLFRAIGLVFVIEWSRGNLPGIFAHPAGWGDLAAALAALGVLLRHRGKEIPPRAAYFVAAVGIADVVNAFFFGFFSSPTELQLFAFDRPNQVIEYPTGLIPMFLITFALVFHVLSITEARRQVRASRQQPAATGAAAWTPQRGATDTVRGRS